MICRLKNPNADIATIRESQLRVSGHEKLRVSGLGREEADSVLGFRVLLLCPYVGDA